jgi:phosphatidylinositol kinase/protein kinase (PI-3  family)
VKTNDDLRQEQFAMQLIQQMDQIFKHKKLPLWLHCYEILATGAGCGLIEAITDSMSIDGIKKKLPQGSNLLTYFKMNYGSEKGKCF